MWPNLQETADLIAFTEEILNEKPNFLCSEWVLFILLKVVLSLVFGQKQFTKTRTKLFAFLLPSQFSISCFLFPTLSQNELHKNLKMYSKGDFFTIESLKINENISIIRQEINFNLLTLREMNYKDNTTFFRLIKLLSGDINLNHSNFGNLVSFQKTRVSLCLSKYK